MLIWTYISFRHYRQMQVHFPCWVLILHFSWFAYLLREPNWNMEGSLSFTLTNISKSFIISFKYLTSVQDVSSVIWGLLVTRSNIKCYWHKDSNVLNSQLKNLFSSPGDNSFPFKIWIWNSVEHKCNAISPLPISIPHLLNNLNPIRVSVNKSKLLNSRKL